MDNLTEEEIKYIKMIDFVDKIEKCIIDIYNNYPMEGENEIEKVRRYLNTDLCNDYLNTIYRFETNMLNLIGNSNDEAKSISWKKELKDLIHLKNLFGSIHKSEFKATSFKNFAKHILNKKFKTEDLLNEMLFNDSIKNLKKIEISKNKDLNQDLIKF